MTPKQMITKIQAELQKALDSQSKGNSGRARVCARRAAGWAVQEYFNQQGIPSESPSAMKHLHQLADTDGLPDRVYAAVHHLTIKLEKDAIDEEAYYPIDGVDLISEAHWLTQELLQTEIDLPITD